ncbi:hypothetical protein DESC_290150 [Desulfosarcina cetonica]|nr:hypothetical protein DESC_290150 [Desulfosarcina cetonica]
MEKMAVTGAETPPQMDQAVAADRDPPYMTGEPGEFGRGRPEVAASLGLAVARDLKKDTGRIGKCVNVRPADNPFFGWQRNHLPTLSA